MKARVKARPAGCVSQKRTPHALAVVDLGWSTTLAAAVDPRIQLSFPTAGSVPFDLKVGPYRGSDTGASCR